MNSHALKRRALNRRAFLTGAGTVHGGGLAAVFIGNAEVRHVERGVRLRVALLSFIHLHDLLTRRAGDYPEGVLFDRWTKSSRLRAN